MGKRKEMAIIQVVEAVDRALQKYSSDNVDVVRNEETNMLDIIYHSKNNSFPIECNVANYDHINIKKLESELGKSNVGYCW